MKKIKKALSLLLVLSMVLCMGWNTSMADALSDEPAAYALTTGTKPSDGTTTGQPFSSGTGGSTNFRIPALVTLSDGTLVAAADARWNQTGDGWGLDTIVSRSSDDGTNWSYTFANYLGDNGNVYNSDSTAFIDPALAVASGDTIYMLVDLYPHGTYIGNVKAGTGFDSNGHLLLRTSSGSSYDYYVGDFTDGKAGIYKIDGTEVSGYTVDEYYNITGSGCNTNLFFSDSPYQVLSTSYLYLTKSTDGGATWSAPMMLNSQVKNSSDMFYGVGPGRGLVTTLSDGTERIIFPCYTYTTEDGNTSVIYSDDGGETWTRSADMSEQSSEAALVEADGNIYMFTRHGGYYVSQDNGAAWGSRQSVSGISYTTTCQLSAITYSETIDGKTAILLSAPTSGRTTGKIFVGLVQDDGSISWDYTYSVNGSGDYAYSCLTELSDGSVGLLYENASGSITYTNLAIAAIASGAEIGDGGENTKDDSEETVTDTKNVTLYVGKSTTVTDSTGNYESSYTGSGLNTGIATVGVKGTTVEGSTTITKVTSVTNGESYLISDGNGNYLTLSGNSITNSTDSSTATKWTITRNGNYYTIKSGNLTLSPYNNGYGPNVTGTQYTTWSYDSTKGIGDPWGYGYNLYYNNGWKVGSTSSGYGAAYRLESTEPVDATTITITGVAPGETSVVVGKTQYNISVKEAPDYVDLSNTPFTSGTGQYAGQKVTKLTTSVNKSYDLNLNISGSSIVWSSENEEIATVDQNGTITGVSSGETAIICTVDGVDYRIPVVVVSDSYGGSYDYTCDIRISEISSTTVRYSLNLSTSLLDAQEGEAIYLGYSYPFCINFFGVEDEGYALTYMASTNSAGNYYSLYQVDALSELAAYNGGAIKNQYKSEGFESSDVDTMLWYAVNEGYHGTMGWTRTTTYTGSSIYSDLTFRSEKLPTVEKTIKTVNGVDYIEGMTAKAGDVIVYDVVVTQYATSEAITYSNVELTDNLSGAIFQVNNSNTVSPSLSSSTLTANRTYEYTVTYTITDDDLDKDIINTVDLSYSYKGQYSEGSYGGSASAEAKISAPTFTPHDIVIDFGLPVEIDYSNTHGRYDLVSGTASYGDVDIVDNIVTYIPHTVLRGVDTVTLTNTAGGTTAFKVYPATTVYYEEGFASYRGNWTSTGSKGIDTQAAQIAGESNDVYGYDAKYADEAVGASNDTQATSADFGDYAEFTFTGTGVDIYTNNTPDTGFITIQVRNSADKLMKLLQVNTAMINGGSSATANQNISASNFVIASIDMGTHDTYSVKILHSKDSDGQVKTVNIDGFRVYGTLAEEPEFYTADKEDAPVYIELRDRVLASLNAEADASNDYKNQIAANIYSQVYATANDGMSGAVIISSAADYSADNLADLLDNGPKNEIYLQPKQAIIFRVSTNRCVQLGLRAVTGDVTYKINDNEQTITSSTDMFYTIFEGDGNATGEQTFTIVNTSDNILSITKVKICDDPNAELCDLAEEDIKTALISLGIIEDGEGTGPEPTEPEVTYADAALTVQVNDAVTVLTKNGVVGESAVFTAEEIKAAAEALVSDGYTLDEAAYTDVEVAYGEGDTVTFTASEEAAEPEPDSILDKIKDAFIGLIGKLFGRH